MQLAREKIAWSPVLPLSTLSQFYFNERNTELPVVFKFLCKTPGNVFYFHYIRWAIYTKLLIGDEILHVHNNYGKRQFKFNLKRKQNQNLIILILRSGNHQNLKSRHESLPILWISKLIRKTVQKKVFEISSESQSRNCLSRRKVFW